MKPPVKYTTLSRSVVAFGCIILSLALNAETDPEKKTCQQNLSFLFEALEAHHDRYQRHPNWLSDLIPEFIANPKILICPKAKTLGLRGPKAKIILHTVYSDPKTSYSYEICAGYLESDIWEGRPITYAEYKSEQIKLVGNVVPIIRCPHHDKHLNLSHAGVIYESDLYWEETQSDVQDTEDLKPYRLFAETKTSENDKGCPPESAPEKPSPPRATTDRPSLKKTMKN